MLKQQTLQQDPDFIARQGQVRKPAGLGMGIASPQKIWQWHCSAPIGIPDAIWGFLRISHPGVHYPVG
ncbi:MAG: hypothetical protein AAFY26_12670 [Cyanobacteria bacterium J06638_22]